MYRGMSRRNNKIMNFKYIKIIIRNIRFFLYPTNIYLNTTYYEQHIYDKYSIYLHYKYYIRKHLRKREIKVLYFNNN